ncbi:MAG: ComF family protein [Cytophagaceae bacterium]|nr:ComF family protein [Cytophagaceae bacterium]
MFHALLDLLFPRYCLACYGVLNRGEETICTTCRYEIPRTITQPAAQEALQQKFYGRSEVASLGAFLTFTKGGKVQRVLRALKYKGHQEAGELLGRWYGAELKESGFDQAIDVIIPVPLHRKRQKERGYNQSDCFAKGLSESLEIAWTTEILRKGKHVKSQTSMSRIQRMENVQDVFFVENPDRLVGKRVALVDDVITTGATLEACVEALKQNGCREVHILTIATAT